MEVIGAILALSGAMLSIYYAVVLIILAFKSHILWGIGYLFVPLVWLIFVIIHWQTTKRAFWLNMLGGFMMVLGVSLIPGAADMIQQELRALK